MRRELIQRTWQRICHSAVFDRFGHYRVILNGSVVTFIREVVDMRDGAGKLIKVTFVTCEDVVVDRWN